MQLKKIKTVTGRYERTWRRTATGEMILSRFDLTRHIATLDQGLLTGLYLPGFRHTQRPGR